VLYTADKTLRREIAFILACDIRFYLRPLLSHER